MSEEKHTHVHVLEDGTVTLCPEDAGLHSRPIEEGATCNLDGSGC